MNKGLSSKPLSLWFLQVCSAKMGFRFFALLSVTLLLSFGDNRGVLGVAYLIRRITGYPDIEDIRKNFRPTPKHGTLMMAVTTRYLSVYHDLCADKKFQKFYIYESFPDGYMDQRIESLDDYLRFYDLCNRVYLEGASGRVHVATDNGKLPGSRNCRYFEDFEYGILDKSKVTSVFLVQAMIGQIRGFIYLA